MAGRRKTATPDSSGAASTRAPKYVYAFANGKAEGIERPPAAARRQGLRAGRDDQAGRARCRPASPSPPRPGPPTTRRARSIPPGLWKQVLRAPGAARGRRGEPARRSGAPAPRLGALRSAGVHAGHDGHRPQPRSQRQVGRGAGAPDPERPLRVGLLPPLHHPVRDVVLVHRPPRLRRAAGRGQGAGEGAHRRRPARRRAPGAGGASSRRSCRRRPGRPFPQDPLEQLRLAINAVFDSWWAKKAVDYRRINRLVRRLGHRGDRDGDGVRQPRPHLGHRGLLLARSLERRAALLRRVPGQRPGRGRGGGHPHPGADRRPQAEDARGLRQALGDQGPARSPLPRHAGHRVHGAGRPALHLADALRQADRRGRGAHRGGDGQPGEADRPRTPRSCGSSRPRSTSCWSRPSTRRPSTPRSPRACPPPPRPRSARWCSIPRRRSRWPCGRRRSSSCGPRRRPRTWPACTRRRAS